MKTAARLHLVLAAALATSVASIACSAPPDQSIKSGERDDDNTSSGDKKNPTTAATAKSETTPPPAATTQPVTTPDASAPLPTDPMELCFQQCIAVDPAAKQIDDQFMACIDGCGENLQCESTCGQTANQACQNNPTSCEKLGQCDEQCFTE
jgi:hypothetical protein